MTSLCQYILLFISFAATLLSAEPTGVERTIDGLLHRLLDTMSEDELIALKEHDLIDMLTPEERRILGTTFIEFDVDRPVVVYVLRSIHERGEIFWLEDQGFEKTGLSATVGFRKHAIWRKSYPAGQVGLGINTFVRSQDPCFFAVGPRKEGVVVNISNISPGYIRLGQAEADAPVYVDDLMEVDELPDELKGLTLVRPKRWVRDHARLIGLFKRTLYPSGAEPDQVALTWSGDPSTTQAIQWRTGPEVKEGAAAYMKKSDFNQFTKQGEPQVVKAETSRLYSPDVVNDPVNFRHTVKLEGLEPDTTYLYSVGDGSAEGWSELSEFSTAPGRVEPFSFIYMGDIQVGMGRWESLAEQAFRARPDAAFHIFAGDLVDRGVDRDDWDDLFENGATIFRQRQLIPVIGNHEGYGADRHPTLYLELLELPDVGPEGFERERAYSLRYGNALFIVLDSMLPADEQAVWMEEILKNTGARWKFVTFHFPIYSAQPDRDYKTIREAWVPVFDRYEVDMVLQGHDHVYARSFPLRNHQRVAEGERGTYYVIAYAGTKETDLSDMAHAEVQFEHVPTYQVLDIQVNGDRLLYRAYDIDGNLRDEVVIEK